MSVTVNIHGIDLHYHIQGAGPHLTLIGGLGTGLWLWERNITELANHFTVLTFDNRGAGKSGKPAGPYTIAQMTDDTAELLRYLNISRTHILGVSMGGFIAQQFALEYPEMVDRLVLVATGPGRSISVPMSEEVLQLLIAPSVGDSQMMRKKFQLAFTPEYLEHEMDQLIITRLKNPQPPEAYLAQAQAGAMFDRSKDLSRIMAPCLIMSATGDVIIPPENARILARNIPNSKLKIYEGFAHQFLVENAENFNRDVIDFLI